MGIVGDVLWVVVVVEVMKRRMIDFEVCAVTVLKIDRGVT